MASAGVWAGWFLDLDLGPGYDGGPAVGPGGRGSAGPWVSFLARRDGSVLVRWGAGWPGRVAMRW